MIKSTSPNEHRSFSSQGATLLETVLYLLLSSLLLGSVMIMAREVMRFTKKASVAHTAAEHSALALAHLTKHFQSVDSARFLTSVVVHSAGVLRYTDSSDHPQFTNPALNPAPHSDALSSLALETDNPWLMSRCLGTSYSATVTLCALGKSEKLDENTRDFVLLSLTGPQFVKGLLEGSGKCRNGSLTRQRSLVIHSVEAEELCFSRLAFPVANYQTLYVDQEGTLRLLYHEGEITSANQPLIASFGRMHLSLFSDQGVPSLEATLRNSGGYISRRTLRSRLERISHLNLLLNL